MAPADIAVGVASRIYPGETLSGDAWQLDWHAGRCRIAVIDGLGHGPQAAAAAEAALKTLAGHPELSPSDALRACHTALVGTRGAAISIATIDTARQLMVYAGVGNVDGHLLRDGRHVHLMDCRGIVGATLPSVRDLPFEVSGDWLLVIHTDGIRARFRIDEMPPELRADPQQLAEAILSGWGRESDDATIVVLRPTPRD